MTALLEQVAAAGLTPAQIDELQTWLLWQSLARARRASRSAGNRHRTCLACGRRLRSPAWATARQCASCVNRVRAHGRTAHVTARRLMYADSAGRI